jgi:hypothetical protein
MSSILRADEPFAFVQVSRSQQRLEYLATARIWSDPGPLTPEDLRRGPRRDLPPAVARALTGDPLPCSFVKPGKALGGKTPKFVCRTAGGATIRVKYTDGTEKGNREVFSLVAATRLMWALGFEADPIYPVTVICQDCPADPMTGSGAPAERRYLAIFQPRFSNVVMVDGNDPNQGWRWGELDDAIEALPPGEVRDRQRTHFDALTLLGVIFQHGDRKSEQQRLSCGGPIAPSAGDVHPIAREDGHGFDLPVFFEHPGQRACADPVVTVQDVGATFGGAGRTSNALTAKMHLASWAGKPVFRPARAVPAGQVPECRGDLTVSMAAGDRAHGNPRVGDAGRRLLLSQFQRLTDAHLVAILTAARVDQMAEPHVWRDARTGRSYRGVDAWVAALRDKVRQIEERSCAP